MCTYLNGCLVAFTGEVPPGLTPAKIKQSRTRQKKTKMVVKPVKVEKTAEKPAVIPEHRRSPQGNIAVSYVEGSIPKNDRDDERRSDSHHGRNNRYKNRVLRATGSGKARTEQTRRSRVRNSMQPSRVWSRMRKALSL